MQRLDTVTASPAEEEQGIAVGVQFIGIPGNCNQSVNAIVHIRTTCHQEKFRHAGQFPWQSWCRVSIVLRPHLPLHVRGSQHGCPAFENRWKGQKYHPAPAFLLPIEVSGQSPLDLHWAIRSRCCHLKLYSFASAPGVKFGSNQVQQKLEQMNR